MPQRLVDQLIGTAARRCSVPRGLEPIIDRGAEDRSDEGAERIWTRVEALYRSGMHPAVQLCIRHDGHVVTDRSIGYARGNLPGRRFDPDRAVPMTVETPMNLFSAAKSVTAMSIHKLEEQGAPRLDDRVADHVPGFARHGKGDMTIRHVLTHRAGIPTMPDEAFDLGLLGDHERVERIVCELRPTTPPGEKPAYHAITGGFVLEALTRRSRGGRRAGASERSWPRTSRRHSVSGGSTTACRPTRCPRSPGTSRPGSRSARDRRLREAGHRQGLGPLLRMSNDERFLSGVIPSGNVIVTARDIGTFYQCLLDGGTIDGSRVFEPETVDRAIRAGHDHLPVDRMLGLPMPYSPGFMLGSDSFSLYGWDHPNAFGHIGLSNLFTWADPDRDPVVALLTTGKPVFGTHLVSLPQLIATIHQEYPIAG